MPEYAVTLTHEAGTCPVYDDKAMKEFQELSEKREAAAKKLRVRVISKWSPTRIHQTYWIIEAPSREAAEEYFKAVGLSIWNKVEVQEVKLV